MAIVKEITIDINNNIPETMHDLRALKKELKATAAGSAEFTRLTNEIDGLQDKLKSAKNTSEDWIDSMQRQPGIMGAAGTALNGLKVSTQSWGAALKATGIGLIVGALGLLAGAFSHNDNMMKKMQPILDKVGELFQGIFKAVEPLVDIFIDLATEAMPYVVEGLQVVTGIISETISYFTKLGKTVYKLFTGDFKGALEEGKSIVTGFGDAYKKTTSDFKKGTEEMTEKEKEELQKRLEAQKEAEKERQKLEDEKLKKIKEEEERKKEARIQARKEELEKINNQRKEFDDLQAEKDKDKYQSDKKAKEDAAQHLLDNIKAQAAAVERDKKQRIQDEKDIADAKVLLADNTMALITEIAGKGSKIGKLIQAQQIIRSGWGAVMNTFKTASDSTITTVFPAYPFLQAGIAGAFSALQLKNLMADKKPSGGSAGGGSSAGGGVSVPSFNLVKGSGTNQITEGLAKNNQPIKAYVTSGDVTTGQSLDRNRVQGAKF